MNSLNRHFNDIILDELFYQEPNLKALSILVRDNMQKRLDEISKKKQSAQIYMKTLAKIGKGHQTLYEQRNRIKSKQLLATIKGYAQAIGSLINQFKELE